MFFLFVVAPIVCVCVCLCVRARVCVFEGGGGGYVCFSSFATIMLRKRKLVVLLKLFFAFV